jgi:hypothetical protein
VTSCGSCGNITFADIREECRTVEERVGAQSHVIQQASPLYRLAHILLIHVDDTRDLASNVLALV